MNISSEPTKPETHLITQTGGPCRHQPATPRTREHPLPPLPNPIHPTSIAARVAGHFLPFTGLRTCPEGLAHSRACQARLRSWLHQGVEALRLRIQDSAPVWTSALSVFRLARLRLYNSNHEYTPSTMGKEAQHMRGARL